MSLHALALFPGEPTERLRGEVPLGESPPLFEELAADINTSINDYLQM